jgi:hypothetical protein
MRAAEEDGHEVGVLSPDPMLWVEKAALAEMDWTRRQMESAVKKYELVMGKSPLFHAAAGWQVNHHLLTLEQEFGFEYSSDVRGKTLFLPQLQHVKSSCIQIPTTLPTIHELLSGEAAAIDNNVHEYLYAESQYISPHGHVFSIDAESEGDIYFSQMEKLVVMWRGFSEGLSTLGGLQKRLGDSGLLRHQIGWGEEVAVGQYVARQAMQV